MVRVVGMTSCFFQREPKLLILPVAVSRRGRRRLDLPRLPRWRRRQWPGRRSDPAVTDNPWISAHRVRAALDALGLTGIRSTHPDRPVDPAFLAGARYRWAAAAVTAEDPALAEPMRARLSVDRLHRIADALPTSRQGALPLAEVAGPAAMAAANVLALASGPAPTSGLVASAITAAAVAAQLDLRRSLGHCACAGPVWAHVARRRAAVLVDVLLLEGPGQDGVIDPPVVEGYAGAEAGLLDAVVRRSVSYYW
jgi:hypothetical protein